MDLKKFLPKKEDDPDFEYFWSIVIEPGWTQAGIWRIEGDKVSIDHIGSPAPWDKEEVLIEACDTSLSSAIQNFPENSNDPTKAVFAVISSWVKDGEIASEHIGKIKKICDELSLQPIGFVVLSEAIAHFLKFDEGSPLSSIVLGLYENEIEISLFQSGKLIGVNSVARSVSIVDDITEGLVRFYVEGNFPSRLILFDGKEKELEEAKQAILKYNWEDSENLSFLHSLKVDVIDPNKKIKAVSFSGASETSGVNGYIDAVDQSFQTTKMEEEDKEPAVKEPLDEIGETSQAVQKKPSEMGFVLNEDVTEKEVFSEPQEASKVETYENISKEQLDNLETVSLDANEKKEKFSGNLLKEKILLFFTGLKKGANNFFARLNKLVTNVGFGKKPMTFGIVFLVLFMILGLLFWWFYPKATITLYVSPRKISEEIEISIDTGSVSSEGSDNKLSASLFEKELSGEKTKSTTGTKTVGEKATGEVTIYRVGPKITIPSNTSLKGPGDLEFTLDEEVELASGSAGSPGNTNAKVTAKDIGASYNLASGSTFSIGNFSTSDIEAKNDSSFEGGSSREITSVSESDQESLLKDLQDELLEKASEEFESEIAESEFLIKDSLSSEIIKEDYSGKVGDEADNVSLQLEVKYTALIIDEEEMYNLIEKSLESKVPDGFVLEKSQIDISFDEIEKENNSYKINLEANLLPSINTDEVKKEIVGKYPEIVNEFLSKKIPGFVGLETKLNIKLPGRLGTLPRVLNNIDIEVSSSK